MPTKLNFEVETSVTKWAVEPIIPLGQLCFFLAQAGVGKSLLLESLAVHVVHGVPFCGFKTNYGDVLLIDQDTPTEVLINRLIKFGKALGTTEKHNLIVSSMEGVALSGTSLMTLINDYPKAVLVIIDSLHSMCNSSNPNTFDMNRLSVLKAKCLTPNKTIAINHHISEKKELSLDDLMVDNPHSFAMGNSAINQQADTYYIVGASAENGTTNKLYLRPVAKRVNVRSTPLVFQMIQPTSTSERLEYLSDWAGDMNQVEVDCMALFKEDSSDRTVRQIFDGMGQQHAIGEVRRALKKLKDKGWLIRSAHRHNQFHYRLPEKHEMQSKEEEKNNGV